MVILHPENGVLAELDAELTQFGKGQTDYSEPSFLVPAVSATAVGTEMPDFSGGEVRGELGQPRGVLIGR